MALNPFPPLASAFASDARTLKVGLFGRGRLGALVAEAVQAAPDLRLCWALGRNDRPGEAVDVALDLSVAAALGEHLEWAAASNTPLVIGSTGWDSATLERTAQAQPSLPLMTAPNFSLGMAMMRRLAEVLARYAALTGADLALYERHHRHKADAPSGSARLLADALVQASPRHHGWGDQAAQGQVFVASLRAGAAPGYHEMRADTAEETLLISHEAHSRALFAQGALAALRWLPGQTGLQSFDGLAAELLAPVWEPQLRGEPQ